MADTLPKIQSFTRIIPMIYAYATPGVTYHTGWLKIGYTEKQSVEERIAEQTHTAGIRWELAWKNNAMYTDGSGEYFTDHEFHRYLTVEKQVEREPKTEWFHVDKQTSRDYFASFASREIPVSEEKTEYILRKEQQEAVEMTKAYFENGGKEFLWNAKPRFGKTLTAYDLIRQMGLMKILIVTNRPSIANAWSEDFNKFIGWRGELCFVSDTDALRNKTGVLTRNTYLDVLKGSHKSTGKIPGMVAFESLQGLKGSVYFGGNYRKLEWMAKEYTDGYGKKQHGTDFDLLIIDEAQEGIDTLLTERAFGNISRKYTLYLSGTPFKALASERFSEQQIFNWSYADEQEAKANWTGEEHNPYETLPCLAMYTYQLSNMIYEEIKKGIELPDEKESMDYAFDLNEFFSTNEKGNFVHEKEIKKFLHTLATQEKYPFSTPELRQELSHTLWLLNRVDSVKALAKLLKADPVFGEYEVVIAAGDGKLNEEDTTEKAFDRVKEAIQTHEKTITLSVGQLTVGVTIKEWSGVLMLCNLQSPSSYMQAAFRAQNPCTIRKDGKYYSKETAYVFDFDPSRTLIIFDEFANNLSPATVSGKGTSDERKENIRRLLNFFPVIGEDEEGTMIELDAAKVLSIPRKIKSQEVVRRGFMSNFLFQNISNVFGAPGVVKEIIDKLTPAKEEKKKREKTLPDPSDVKVDENGDVRIPEEIVIGTAKKLFGPKQYEQIEQNIVPEIKGITETGNTFGPDSAQMEQQIKTTINTVKEMVKKEIVFPVIEEYKKDKRYKVTEGLRNRMEKQADNEIDKEFEKIQGDYLQQMNIAKAERDRKSEEARTKKETDAVNTAYQSNIEEALNNLTQTVLEASQKIVEGTSQKFVEQMELRKGENEKKTIEDTVRDHLRGFSRTIPSFIMAYGDENLVLRNFDDYTEDDVFEEVTGITEADFRFLRDGGEYYNSETGETEYFKGHLFDEVVFNDSIVEFWQKKQKLADYFEEGQDEDIFDYIPPQKTNQIFTPRWVVEKMVDELETNNPGCFDDPNLTFADLYMKSGLYITEIVKRLFRSERMKETYPDETERVRHILRKQVYGMAPTRIIYLIATNYILGFDEQLKSETHHFVQADAAFAAKEDRLAELVEKFFGEKQ